MTQNTRILARFEFHVEDVDCAYCKHVTRKMGRKKDGCGFAACPYNDIRQDALAHGRIKRKRGWFRWEV